MPNEQKKSDAKSQKWQYHPQALLRYVLSLDDTPHSIALGTSIGMFIGLTPTPGLQMLLVLATYYACSRLFRFNLPAGLAAVYVSNPLTAVPLAWAGYTIGRFFVGGELTREEIAAVLQGGGDGNWLQKALALLTELGYAYLIGSVVLAIFIGVLTYPIMRYLFHFVNSTTTQQNQTPTPLARELPNKEKSASSKTATRCSA